METQRKIPHLRFPEFKDEWESKIINDTCNIVGGGTPDSGKEEYWNGNIQWFTPTEIKMDYVSTSERTITERGLKKSSARILPKGTILLTSRATIGEVAIALNECTTNQGFQSLIVNPEYDIIFIFNWIKNNKNHFIRRANGSTFLEISKSEIGIIPIIIPTLPEQQRIASFFTAIDKKISQLKQKKTLLEQYKKGVMQKIFSQQIRFKDDDGNDFPKWDKKKLGEIAKFRRGSFPQPYGLEKWYDDINGSPFIQVFDVDDNFRLKTGTKNKISDVAKPFSVYVKEGTVVLTIQGSIGRIAITQYDSFVDRTLLIFEEYLIPINKYFFINIIYLLFQIEKRKAPGGTIKTITKEVLSDFKIWIPCIQEQTKIANFLSSIDDKIFNTQKQIDKAEVWKKGLMQQMFV